MIYRLFVALSIDFEINLNKKLLYVCNENVAKNLRSLCSDSYFFPYHMAMNWKYSKSDSLLKYFEQYYINFENYSFGKNIRQDQEISWCRLGSERALGEEYNGFMIIELEYRKGTLFNAYPNTKFSNIIVYSEINLTEVNPRPELFRQIQKN